MKTYPSHCLPPLRSVSSAGQTVCTRFFVTRAYGLLTFYRRLGIRWGPSRVREVRASPPPSLLRDSNVLCLRVSCSTMKNRHSNISSRRRCTTLTAREYLCSLVIQYPLTLPPSSGFDPAHHILIKQTYTVFVDTPRGQRKWHLSESRHAPLFYMPNSCSRRSSRLLHRGFHQTTTVGR